MTRPTLPSIPQYRIFTEHHFKSVDHHGENFMSSRFCHLNLKIVLRLFTGFQDWSMLGFYSYNWHFIVWPIQYQILTFKFQQCNYNQILNQLQINSNSLQISKHWINNPSILLILNLLTQICCLEREKYRKAENVRPRVWT